jgi:hypothetical protein
LILLMDRLGFTETTKSNHRASHLAGSHHLYSLYNSCPGASFLTTSRK